MELHCKKRIKYLRNYIFFKNLSQNYVVSEPIHFEPVAFKKAFAEKSISMANILKYSLGNHRIA